MRTEVLVTGAGGLLGHAVKKFFPDAACVTSQDCDLRDIRQVERLFRFLNPSKVIHLAGVTAGVKANAMHNADLFTDNVLINTNVLSVAQKQNVGRLISVLSSCAYPVFLNKPSTEEDLHEGMPFTGNLGYGYAKRMLDIHTRLLRQQHGCHYTTLTPVTMYGPYDNWNLETGHVLGALIHKCFLAKHFHRPFQVWGSGRAVRQFVFAEDVARLILDILDSPDEPNTVIVSPDEGISIRDLADLIARLMQFEGSIDFDQSQPEGLSVKLLRSNRFKEAYPNFQFTPLAEGLRETIHWFMEHEAVNYLERKAL